MRSARESTAQVFRASALTPETGDLPRSPMAAQVDNPLPTLAAECGSRNVSARAVTTIENEFVLGSPGKVGHPQRHLRKRDVDRARHVAGGKLPFRSHVKNMQR